MSEGRNVLTPEALTMMDVIARTGSFAAAARELGKVPSSLTYNVRQLEDALDVLLFDRRSRQARLTAAGAELLLEGRRLLEQIDAVANRVKRVATGWEAQLSIAVDGAISSTTLWELCEAFYAIDAGAPATGTPRARGAGTRLALRTQVLAGTWEALISGQADLAIGVGTDRGTPPGIQMKELGALPFVFAISPRHPLAASDTPVTDSELLRHRAVAVADTAQRLAPLTVNLLPGQDVLTVSSLQAKVEALIRCLGCGFVPEPLVRRDVAEGRLVLRPLQRVVRDPVFGYAWRSLTPRPTPAPTAGHGKHGLGLALRWWLGQLESPATRSALLERHAAAGSRVVETVA